MMVVDGPSLKGESMVLLVSKKTTIQKFQPTSRISNDKMATINY